MPVPASTTLVYLNGTAMPPQFSYEIPVLQKRINVVKTYGYVIIQKSPTRVPADSIIEWSIESACPEDYMTIYNLWTGGDTFSFTGYWGESFTVFFEDFETPKAKGRFFELAGKFRVTNAVSWIWTP